MPVNRALWSAINYNPHPKQVLFHASKARFKVPASGRRFGKSRMAAAEVEPYIMDPTMRGRAWIVAPDYSSADEFQYIYDDLFITLAKETSSFRRANNPRTGEMFIETPWGLRLEVKSAQHLDSLAGKGLRFCVLSEAAKLPEIVFKKYISPALADYKAPCIMPSTPEGMNWYKKAYDRGQSGKHPEWESWNFPAWENPFVYPLGFDDPEIQRQLADNPNDPYFWQELGADFTALVGRVYPNFDPKKHVQPWKFDAEVENYLAFDFGFSAPFVCLDIQVTPSEVCHVWREYYLAKLPVHRHAQELAMRTNPEGYRIDGAYGDAADANAVETISSILHPVVALNEAKDVPTGIQEVSKMIDQGRLLVDPSCTNFIYEMDQYRMKEARAAGKQTTEDPKDEPIKKNNHALDAFRYFVMHHFKLGAGMHLEEDMNDEDVLGEDETYFKYEDDGMFTMTGAA